MPDVDLTKLPHEDWCDMGSLHADCCPGKAEFGCSCITRDVVRALAVRGEVREEFTVWVGDPNGKYAWPTAYSTFKQAWNHSAQRSYGAPGPRFYRRTATSTYSAWTEVETDDRG